jgi:excisionase family DNA binding protein
MWAMNELAKQPDLPEAFYTVEELAEYLKVANHTVRLWIRDGKVSAVRIGRSYRIPLAEVRRIVSEGIPED